MAQLRQDYEQFLSREAEVLVIAPDTLDNAQAYFKKNQLPYPGLIDDTQTVYEQFDIQSRMLSMGQRPGLFIIDKGGIVRYAYLGTQQWEIPSNTEVLAQLDILEK